MQMVVQANCAGPCRGLLPSTERSVQRLYLDRRRLVHPCDAQVLLTVEPLNQRHEQVLQQLARVLRLLWLAQHPAVQTAQASSPGGQREPPRRHASPVTAAWRKLAHQLRAAA
eukprot:1459708-Pleurochrysis_carterae.AAC.3